MAGFRIVAWTNAPRLAALVIVQPDWAGDIPPVPVSWYGVASPRAVSGFAGTMMSQFTLAAVVTTGVLALAAALALGCALPLADGLAAPPRADWSRLDYARLRRRRRSQPTTSPSATGTASGIAIRATRILCARRRLTDGCLLLIESTSVLTGTPQRQEARPGRRRDTGKSRILILPSI